MTASEIAFLLKTATDILILLKKNGVSDEEISKAIEREEARSELLLQQLNSSKG